MVEYSSCASNQHTARALLYHVISTLPSGLPESILMGDENDSPRLLENATFTLGSPLGAVYHAAATLLFFSASFGPLTGHPEMTHPSLWMV